MVSLRVKPVFGGLQEECIGLYLAIVVQRQTLRQACEFMASVAVSENL